MGNFKYSNVFFISVNFLILTTTVYLLSIGKTLLPVFLLTVPLLFILIENVHKNYLYYLTSALFIEQYFYVPLKIQVINVIAYLIFLFFLVNKDTNLFNALKLPGVIKYSSAFFIFAVFLSSINTVHLSAQSLYFFLLFLTYLFTGYIVFRSIKDDLILEKFFKVYFYGMFVTCLIIVIQTAITSKLRSSGLIGYSVMDFSAITLSLLILKYFIRGKLDYKILLISLFTLIVLIITLSRFAWIGFILSLMYGILITYKYDHLLRDYLKNKLPLLILSVVIVLGILIGIGVNSIISQRFSDLSFEFFEPNEEGEIIQNSLETRTLIWITAYSAFESNPVTGIGYQMFNYVSEEYSVIPYYLFEEYVENLDPHNTMLAFLTETGITGFAAFLIFIISVYIISFKSIKISMNEKDKVNSILLNVVVFFIFLNSFYSGQYTMAQQAFFMYIFLGLNIGNYAYLKNKLTAENSFDKSYATDL